MRKKLKTEQRKRRADRDLLWPACLFLAALLVRLVHIYGMRASPFWNFPVVDSSTYDTQAAEIAAGQWLGRDVFWQAPLYPYFLAVLYKVFGRDYTAVRVVQAVLGSLSCVLVYRIARTVFDRKVAIVSGAGMALYGTAIYFDSELLAPALLVFLTLLLVYSISKSRRRWISWFASGLLLGLLVVGHGLALFLLPACLVWMGLSLRKSLGTRPAVLFSLLFVLGTAIPPGGVTLRNYVAGRDFVFVSSNSGVNFFIGNNPDYDNVVGVRPGLAWERLMREPLDLGLEKHSERSAFFFGKALSFIRSHPGEWGWILLKKFGQFWNGNEVGRNQEIYPLRRYSIPMKLLLWKRFVAFPFGLLGPAAIVGVFVSWRERRRIGLLSLFLLGTIVSVTLFFVCARYRMPAVPFLMVFFGAFAAWIVECTRKKRWKMVLSGALAFLVLSVLVNARSGRMSPNSGPEDYFALGSSCSVRGEKDLAVLYYERAVSLKPGYADALYNLGNLDLADSNYEDALEEYAAAVSSEPTFVEALHNMGVAYSGMGDYASARDAFLRALSLRPRLPEAMVAVGEIYIRWGIPDSAAIFLEKAVSVAPENARAHHDLAVAYYGLGRYNEALEELYVAQSLGLAPNERLFRLLRGSIEAK